MLCNIEFSIADCNKKKPSPEGEGWGMVMYYGCVVRVIYQIGGIASTGKNYFFLLIGKKCGLGYNFRQNMGRYL